MVGSEALLSAFDVDEMSVEALLFQTGYLAAFFGRRSPATVRVPRRPSNTPASRWPIISKALISCIVTASGLYSQNGLS